jgi:predicted RNase H-like nuclease
VSTVRYLGIDLAWAESSASKLANESGVVALDQAGSVLDAGWTIGVEETLGWIEAWSVAETILFVDAPLVVTNESGQRACERQVGQRYGRWKVSANSTNMRSPRLAGVRLREILETQHWTYDDGFDGPATSGRHVSECYPYTTLVGAGELAYKTERPLYKRKPKKMRLAAFRPLRAVACDGLVERLEGLRTAEPPLRLGSHPATKALLDEQSPEADVAYKHREDLIDAMLCAWTAALWYRFGFDRCQVLGDEAEARPRASIIAPARPTQRR